ncbi:MULTISPECIES: hypothetical protein [Microbacterium]|uniref:hypothetical protein n=1 Tax=Microbacterium TaxID=33882 RepID=UPI00146ED9FA|nr:MULTISPECIES: hypothetical protein [Microbacterium]
MSIAQDAIPARPGRDDPSPASSAPRMYGVPGFDDDPEASDYDPWIHAGMLGIPIVFRDDLPDPEMVACYAHEYRAIFVRPNLRRAVETCAIAHEIVHFEYGDVGADEMQEDRADRIAARRLVRPRRVAESAVVTDDAAVVALDLGVTERVMRTYLRTRAASPFDAGPK